MRISFVCRTEFNPLLGGVETVSLALKKAFERKGHTVILISGTRRNEAFVDHSLSPEQYYIEDISTPEEWTSEDIAQILKKTETDILINQSTYDHSFSLKVLKAAGSCNVKAYSVIHNQPVYPLKLTRLARFREKGFDLKKKLVFFIKYILSPYYYRRELKKYRNYLDSLYQNSTGIVFLSEKYISQAEDAYGIRIKDKAAAIANPVCFDEIIDYDGDRKDNTVLFVGRFENYQKRIDRLLTIWKNTGHKLSDWKLVLVGDGIDRPRMEKLAGDLSLGNVVFTGAKNPEEEYRRAKIFCMTSDFEGFSMVLLEALHFGCIPVVLNRFETAAEVIHDGINGFLAENDDDYLKKLLMLAENDEIIKKMENNIPEVINEFGIDSVSEKWLRLFDGNSGFLINGNLGLING